MVFVAIDLKKQTLEIFIIDIHERRVCWLFKTITLPSFMFSKTLQLGRTMPNLCLLLEYLLIKVFGFLWESDLGRSYETRVFLFTNPLKFESKSEES